MADFPVFYYPFTLNEDVADGNRYGSPCAREVQFFSFLLISNAHNSDASGLVRKPSAEMNAIYTLHELAPQRAVQRDSLN